MTELDRFYKENPNQECRYDYDLNEDSIVFDVGGFVGNWAQKIYDLYIPQLHIFEPHKWHYEGLRMRFQDRIDVYIYDYGWSYKDEMVKISDNRESSSIYHTMGENEIWVEMVDCSEIIGDTKVDLLKLNIEGMEYDVLNKLISTGKISQFKDIQVQFHSFVPNAKKRLNNIRKKLQKTHNMTYGYEFVWENWRLKD